MPLLMNLFRISIIALVLWTFNSSGQQATPADQITVLNGFKVELLYSPDNLIYYINGNFVNLPKTLSPSSPHRNYADDQVLPRAEDGNGFGAGKKPPGGFLLRLDKDAKNVEMVAAGMRNTYDFDISPQ